MLRFVLLSIGLLVSAISYCQRITFVSQDSIALPEVRCVGFTAQNDSIFYAVSRSNGIVNIPKGEVSRIVASHEGFRDKIIFMDKLVGDANTVIMLPPVALQEVVVTPKDVKEFATHTSYRISQKDMGRYPTVLQALNEIPNITVLSNGMLFFEGDENVKILIDGVDATTSEVQTLSKEDISKVDVYQIPPLRFIAQGVDAVLDIRLKSKIHGGNGAVDITQAFHSLKATIWRLYIIISINHAFRLDTITKTRIIVNRANRKFWIMILGVCAITRKREVSIQKNTMMTIV